MTTGNFLVKLTTDSLQYVASILDRMRNHGGVADRLEVQGCICDVCDIVLSIDFPSRPGVVGLMGRDQRRAQQLEEWSKVD